MQASDTRSPASWPEAILHAWWTGPMVLGLAAVVVVRLDRFPRWDEGVFLSQAGGIDGLRAPASTLVPSREIGSVWYQQLLNLFVSNYPNLRALHIVVSLAVLTAAVWQLSRAVAVPPFLLSIVLGSYWLTFAFIGDFLRFALLTFVLLGAIGSYLNVLGRTAPRPIDALPPALWFSAALLLGPFEAGMVLLATLLHAVATGFAWRNPRLLAVGVAVGSVAFVLPFLLDTRRRFGSLGERLVQLRGREESPLNNSALDWSLLGDYVSLATQGPITHAGLTPSHRVMNLLLLVSVVVLAVGLLSAVEGLVRLALRRHVPAVTTLLLLAVTLLMVFLGGYYSLLSDRYWILPASLLLLLGTTRLARLASAALEAKIADSNRGRQVAATLGLIAAVGFLVPNVLFAQRIDTHRTGDKEAETILRLTRTSIGDVTCRGASRYNTPAVQWATGCQMSLITSLDDAVAWAQELDPDDGSAFVYWSSSAMTPEAAASLSRAGFEPLITPTEHGPRTQVFLRQ
jgi:hypothetical protein